MNENKYLPMWRAVMATIALVLSIFAFVNISGTVLPDNLMRLLMVMEGIAIMVVSYTTVKIKAIRQAKRPTGKKKKR